MPADRKFAFKTDDTEEINKMLNGSYGDTGRVASNPIERMSDAVQVPMRTAIGEAQKGNFGWDALKKVVGSGATDPVNAPSSEELVENTGIDNPYAKAALQTSIDFGGQMASGMAAPMPGVMGRIIKANPVNAAEQLATKRALLEASAARGVPDIAQPERFAGVKSMFTSGGTTFPASTTADAVHFQKVLEKVGMEPHGAHGRLLQKLGKK